MSASRSWPAATLVFALLAALHTWPLATDPAHLSRNDNGDAQLNEWILAWIAHQLPRDPAGLFDANIFHPEPRTFAFSEPLLLPGLAGAPLLWLGASPVLAYNLLLLAGFVATGLAGYAAAFAFTQDRWAGLLAGSLLAFNAQTLTRLPHLQAHWGFLLPLALVALDRLLGGAGVRVAIGLGAMVASLTVTSGYWAALAVVALGAALAVRSDECLRAARRLAPALVLAALVAVLLALPVLLPYWTAHREQGLTRTLAEAAAFSSTASSYLSTPARLHYAAWSHLFYGPRGGSGFPGVAALLLSALALHDPGALRSARVRMLLAVAAAGFCLSLGPATFAYRWFHWLFPPMQGLRDPSRFAYLVLLAVALLAALGLWALRRRLGGRRALVAGLSAVALANAEALVAPVGYLPFTGFSPVYARLAGEKDVVLAELPLYPASEIYRNAPYVLASSVHWHPLVNGYSGFTPPAFVRRAEILRHFPDGAAIDELRRLGVNRVIVHFGAYREPRASRIASLLAADPGFALLETGPDGERLYRLEPE